MAKQRVPKNWIPRPRPVDPDTRPTYAIAESPFAGLSQEEIERALQAAGDAHATEFDEAFADLQRAVLEADPLLILSAFAHYGLTGVPGLSSEFHRERPILQYQVELIQACILRHDRDTFADQPALPDTLERLHDLAERTSHSFGLRRLRLFSSGPTLEQRRRLAMVERVRLDTQFIRNWGYSQHMIRIVSTLFAPLEARIESRTGLSVRRLLKMGANVVRLAEDRLNAHRQRLHPIMQASTLDAIVRKYLRAFPELDVSFEELRRALRGADPTQAKACLLSHSDLRLPEIYTFTLDDFASCYGTPVHLDALRLLLDSWTLRFGDLAASPPEHAFLGNPIWTQPIISLGPDTFFWPIVGLFFGFGLELTERVLAPYPDLLAAYQDRRGSFLEDDVEELMRTHFPEAKVFRGSMWTDPETGRQYENDLLVVLDTLAFVVEAKAGKVTAPARRGAEKRLSETINELLIEPSRQAARFIAYLRAYPGTNSFTTRSGVPNEVDTSLVTDFVPLSITLEPIADLQASLGELRDAGWASTPLDVELASAMTLSDLDIVLDVLESPLESAHYLTRRGQFAKRVRFLADELDLLAFYLDTGFDVGNDPLQDMGFVLVGLSQKLDPYYEARSIGETVEKPRPRRTKWWADIVRAVESGRGELRLRVAFSLLDLGYKGQQAFEQGFRACQMAVRDRSAPASIEDAFCLPYGSETSATVIVGVAYKGLSTAERNRRLLSAGEQALARSGATRALVIGVDVLAKVPNYSYSVFAVVTPRHVPILSPDGDLIHPSALEP